MTFAIRRIAVRFALLLALAAVVPLIAYGVVSIWSLQRGTRESIVTGNENVATRAAEEIRRYVVTNAELLKALAADLQDTGLTTSQQDRILKNYVLQFREFREVTLFDEAGATIASSRVGAPRVAIPKSATLTIDGVRMSPMRVDEDLLPTALFGVHLLKLNQPAGWLVGEFNLEEMWRMVDRIRIGEHGFAMVVAPDGGVIAHGDPDKKALVAQTWNMSANPLVAAIRAQSSDPRRQNPEPGTRSPEPATPVAREYADEAGRRELGVAAPIPALGWSVIVEQPTSDAFASAAELQRQLIVAISAALFVMIAVGYGFGRSFINPILELKRATHDVAAEGRLDTRVDIRRRDEFGDLGESFNRMADRLVELQEDVKRQERQAMFGRMAAGLVHDLSHPIQNIGNSTRLLLRDDVDPESREMFRRTIERELGTLKRFMEDLRNIVKPKPIERFVMDVNGSLGEIVESMRSEAERNALEIRTHFADGPLLIQGDRFALDRVYRNLITNAIQATPAGGTITVTTARSGDHVEIRVSDTGSGIPPERLAAIFDEFVTTKRRGLGLGLAISKRIVEQLDGTIDVQSEVGRGTAFTLRFPASSDGSAHAAAS
ncbi:MAG TPA: sensor histidine kinase [Vicinamibacterales bacterium]|nr:sensor histidine kinase [Vicinamibacterales bacterium]